MATLQTKTTTNDMEKIKVRSFAAEIRKKNEETRTVTFVASDGSRDSAHTVLNQDGWDLSRFEKNPIIGYNHEIYSAWNPQDVDFVIGKGRAYVEDGKLMVDITFEPKSINELAEKVYQKVLFGSISSVSVGFLPLGEGRWGVGEEAAGKSLETYYFAGQQLLEISVVNIPANGNATKKAEEAVEEELRELRALAVEAPAPEPEPEDRSAENANKVKLLKAAASAALMLNQ